jgi:hypothetical protein
MLEAYRFLPLPTTWRVSCGFLGLDILFVSGPREEDTVTVSLSDVRMTDEECRQYAPLVGSVLRNMLERQ